MSVTHQDFGGKVDEAKDASPQESILGVRNREEHCSCQDRVSAPHGPSSSSSRSSSALSSSAQDRPSNPDLASDDD
eukprot:3173410-Rhodomonas_salina.1